MAGASRIAWRGTFAVVHHAHASGVKNHSFVGIYVGYPQQPGTDWIYPMHHQLGSRGDSKVMVESTDGPDRVAIDELVNKFSFWREARILHMENEINTKLYEKPCFF